MIQSAGNSINPHAHCQATEDALSPDGTFLLIRKIDTQYLTKLFMDHTFTMLLKEKKITRDTIRLIFIKNSAR